MKQQMMKERVELLAIGEALGYPRIGIGHANGRKHSIRAGQTEWERFCAHAHATRVPAALRIGRILRDNKVVPYNPRSAANGSPTSTTIDPMAVPNTMPTVVTFTLDPLDAFPMPNNEPVVVKAKRGRPKGSKNRAKAVSS